ncbi:MAG: glutamine-hydrolyzing carbamoyl-phosphate synthase small subunit [Gammaproteobacteria bacterium]
MNKTNAILLLEDGSTFSGRSIGADGMSVGEVVFNTSMTGYQEIITDPSYNRQIITFTNPHIGNTGVNPDDIESSKIFASGVIIRDEEIIPNSWRKTGKLQDFLKDQGILAIAGVDTRKLTKILRTKGSQNGCIISGKNDLDAAKKKLSDFKGLEGLDLAIKVTTKEEYEWDSTSIDIYNRTFDKPKSNYNIIAYDFGIKHNILRLLVDSGCKIKIVPADYPVDKVLELKPDGVFLSNGPGDPKACDYAIQNIRELLKNKIPMFGICLGFQLLALASGASTVKMKFGHHGANHPVMNLANKKVFITSQNHGFMVDDNNLPNNIVKTHISLFDNSLQGFEIKDHFAFGFQGHPEASPGPNDIREIFNQFVQKMEDKINV